MTTARDPRDPLYGDRLDEILGSQPRRRHAELPTPGQDDELPAPYPILSDRTLADAGTWRPADPAPEEREPIDVVGWAIKLALAAVLAGLLLTVLGMLAGVGPAAPPPEPHNPAPSGTVTTACGTITTASGPDAARAARHPV